MRFDDSLTTVLAFDTTQDVGARNAWRQLIDLIGRRRLELDDAMVSRLRSLRKQVPDMVRTATARWLATVSPAATAVGFFAEDGFSVAGPLLRTVDLTEAGWRTVLPRLTTAQRDVLRDRDDLSEATRRSLAELDRVDVVPEPMPAPEPAGPPRLPDYPLTDLVQRIEAFREARAERAAQPAGPVQPASRFTFRADAAGMLTWVDGVPPGALVGLSLAHSDRQGAGQVDGTVAGAFRHRSRFADARLEVGGDGGASGSWRLSGMPAFDPASGRFLGYDGVGRRPRPDECAASTRAERADSLRQLVHELRTPANAISGFAELIESELMGPVPPAQRSRAMAIRTCANDLVAAIDDLDTAARIDGGALELRPASLSLMPLLDRVTADLSALVELRGATLDVRRTGEEVRVFGDGRVMERLLSRLFAVVVAAADGGERLSVDLENGTDTVRVALSRPAAWHGLDEAALFAMEADGGGDGAPLLGTGFCLRLARNLAVELGGSLAIRRDELVLRFPSAVSPSVGHASGA